jgi:hypothetical protein
MAPVMIDTPAKNLSFLTISLLKNLSPSGTVAVAGVDVDPSDAEKYCEDSDPPDAEAKSVDAGECGNHHQMLVGE